MSPSGLGAFELDLLRPDAEEVGPRADADEAAIVEHRHVFDPLLQQEFSAVTARSFGLTVTTSSAREFENRCGVGIVVHEEQVASGDDADTSLVAVDDRIAP